MGIIKTKSRLVHYNGFDISYQLTRKNVKNINLRIHSDGVISVSANNYVSVKTIDDFIFKNGDFILASLKKFHDHENKKPQPKQYVNGETFRFFDKSFILKITQDTKNYIDFDGQILNLHVNDISDFEKKEKLITDFLDEQCRLILTQMLIQAYPLFDNYKISMPSLKFRKMTSCWGSCRPNKCSITLNTRLMEHSLKAAQYVVVHELAHLVHADHSKNFYAVVAEILPDWKIRKNELNY